MLVYFKYMAGKDTRNIQNIGNVNKNKKQKQTEPNTIRWVGSTNLQTPIPTEQKEILKKKKQSNKHFNSPKNKMFKVGRMVMTDTSKEQKVPTSLEHSKNLAKTFLDPYTSTYNWQSFQDINKVEFAPINPKIIKNGEVTDTHWFRPDIDQSQKKGRKRVRSLVREYDQSWKNNWKEQLALARLHKELIDKAQIKQESQKPLIQQQQGVKKQMPVTQLGNGEQRTKELIKTQKFQSIKKNAIESYRKKNAETMLILMKQADTKKSANDKNGNIEAGKFVTQWQTPKNDSKKKSVQSKI